MSLIFSQKGLEDLTGNYTLSAAGANLKGESLELKGAPIVTSVPMSDYSGGGGLGPFTVLIKFATVGLPSADAFIWKGLDDTFDLYAYAKLLTDGSFMFKLSVTGTPVTVPAGLLRTDGTLNSFMYTYGGVGERQFYLNGVNVAATNYGVIGTSSVTTEFGDPSHDFTMAQARIYTSVLTLQDATNYEAEPVDLTPTLDPLFKHLFPRGRAWLFTKGKQLTKLMAGFSEALVPTVREEVDRTYLDYFADTTRDLERWEAAKGLAPIPVTEDLRRARLKARKRATGGQSPAYIQATLRGAGFDVYVHEFWDPNTEAVRDPRTVLDPSSAKIIKWMAGVDTAICGRSGVMCGGFDTIGGYPLVNKPGGPYFLSDDPNTWPYFLYVGGETFGTAGTVNVDRKEEFERLLLTICPTHLWIGVIVTYSAAADYFILLEDANQLLLESGGGIGLE